MNKITFRMVGHALQCVEDRLWRITRQCTSTKCAKFRVYLRKRKRCNQQAEFLLEQWAMLVYRFGWHSFVIEVFRRLESGNHGATSSCCKRKKQSLSTLAGGD